MGRAGDTRRGERASVIRRQECPHVRMTLITMLAVILLAVSVLGSTETGGRSQTPDSALYNKILSSMDISREVRKVFTSLWATPEVKAIIGGCACFWGGVLVLGVVYIAVVYIKRNFEPEDVKKKMKRALS